MSNIEKFAPRLRTLIDESGITVRSLAKDLNVSVGVLSDWQNGNKTPRGDSIMKLTEYFGVTADYLLGLTDASTIDTGNRIDGFLAAIFLVSPRAFRYFSTVSFHAAHCETKLFSQKLRIPFS